MRALAVTPGAAGSGRVLEVSEPTVEAGYALIDVVRVGLCGTDAEIERGEYGTAPAGSNVLVLGHESLGRVSGGTSDLPAGTLVVASVRRPDTCAACLAGEQDMCLDGNYTERGIRARHGFCAERYADSPRYLFPVPDTLEPVAVLLEPLTISEKGWRHLVAAQRRMSFWTPRRALVTGAGPVGLLAAALLRLRGLDVTVVERTDKPARRQLLARIGAAYGATSVTPLEAIARAMGGVDVVLEATGSSAVAFESMGLVGPNGAVVLTSVTGAGRTLTVAADELNKHIVLGNVLILGTVNAKSADFTSGIADLGAIEERWPGYLGSLITRRVPLADAAAALAHDPQQIKTVVEIGGGAPRAGEGAPVARRAGGVTSGDAVMKE